MQFGIVEAKGHQEHIYGQNKVRFIELAVVGENAIKGKIEHLGKK